MTNKIFCFCNVELVGSNVSNAGLQRKRPRFSMFLRKRPRGNEWNVMRVRKGMLFSFKISNSNSFSHFWKIQICIDGECLPNESAPTSNCIFGDDLVLSSTLSSLFLADLPSPQMTCRAVLDYVSSLNQFPGSLCTDPSFRQTCCETCKSKKENEYEFASWMNLRVNQNINIVHEVGFLELGLELKKKP